MSTNETETKTALSATQAEIAKLEAVPAAVTVEVKTWYEKHLPLLAGIAGLVVGLLVGHFVKL